MAPHNILMLLLWVVWTVVVPGSHSATSPSACPAVPVVHSFQAQKYLGRWYEIQTSAPDPNMRCTTIDYSLLPNCSIGVVTSSTLSGGGGTISQYGYATSAGDPTKGSLVLSLPGQEQHEGTSGVANYNVIATDYANYAIVYSCSIFSSAGQENKLESSLVLARRPRVNRVFLSRLSRWLSKLGIDVSIYSDTNQKRCIYAA